MAYATPEQAFENAATVMRAGANMVKIEGGEWLVETVQMLTERAVPVCGHLGFNTTVSEYFRWLQSSGARR